jgi:Ca2+-binding RTX toxin-like protein
LHDCILQQNLLFDGVIQMTTFVGTNGNDTFNLGYGTTYSINGLDGVDTVTLGASLRNNFTITRESNGTVHVDVISAASEQLHLTLNSVERLIFANGTDTLDLRTYFGDITPPTISSFDPGLNATDVLPSKDIVLSFNEAIVKGTGTITLNNANGTPFASYDIATSPNVSISGSTLTINPSTDLNSGTSYSVTLASGIVKDVAGNNFAGTSTYSFTTKAAVSGGSNLTGSANADILVGTTGNDVINALGGNDRITGGAGDDQISGGDGIDTAIYAGKRADYNIVGNLASATVQDKTAGRDGNDTLNQVERLVFSDGAVALDINGNAGQIYRVYQAAFNRKPDLGGLGYWINDLDHGATLTDVAAGFFGSAEFQALYGVNPSNTTLITNLYANVLHRAPDTDGFNYWIEQLNTGKISAASTLASFAESAENQAQVIGAIQNGIDYTLYVG